LDTEDDTVDLACIWGVNCNLQAMGLETSKSRQQTPNVERRDFYKEKIKSNRFRRSQDSTPPNVHGGGGFPSDSSSSSSSSDSDSSDHNSVGSRESRPPVPVFRNTQPNKGIYMVVTVM
jgi:hypothetical protein